MVSSLPDFEQAGRATGGVIYRKHDRSLGLYIYVFIQPHSKEDRFTLELASSPTRRFPFELMPGDHQPTGEARYRISRILETKSDGWWNVNVSESHLPDLAAIMKTFEPEAIKKALDKLPGLVDDAFDRLKSALPKFLTAIQQMR